MSKKRRFTIRSKILLGYLVVVLLFGAVLLVLSAQIDASQKEIDFISHHDLEVHNLTNSIEKNVLNMETGQRGYMITGEESYLEPYNQALTQWNSNYTELYELVSDNPSQQSTLESIKTHIVRWIDVAGSASVALKRQGDQEKVIEFFHSDPGKSEIDLLRSQFENFRSTELRLTESRVAELAARSSTLLTIMYTLWAAVAGLSVAAAFVISGNIVKTLRQVKHTISDISQGGNLTQRIIVRTHDEVGDLGKETNLLLDTVQEQNRLKDQVANIATLLQNPTSLEGLSRLFLNQVAILLEAPYGVLYAMKENRLIRVAAYAADGEKERSLGKVSVAPGEGLVGQSAMEKRVLQMNDLPQNYIRISSGLGDASAASLTVAPVVFEGKTIAVIELASMKPIESKETKLLTELIEIFGVSLHSTITRMELQHLYDESQVLNEELQTQSEKLQAQTEEMVSQTEELHMQTEELYMLNERLELQKNAAETSASELAEVADQLRTSSGYKSEFLANMSHELRTPLNSMLILSEILAENKHQHLNSEEQKYASVIHASGKDLLNLINDILDLSKVEAGEMEVDLDDVYLGSLPEAMNQYFLKTAEQKGIDFRIQLQSPLPETIVSDEMRLHQILRNLLSNAFKFTNEGEVALTISRVSLANPEANGAETDVIAFSVSDTGIGIADNKLLQIFDAFKQADGATARKYGGTGLGLSISQSLANLLGGSISATSREGQGSVFTLFLPLRREEPEVMQNSRLFLNEIAVTAPETNKSSGENSTNVEMLLTPLEESLLNGRQVLVVDDDIRNVYALANALEQYDMKVITAQNGYECLEMLESGEANPDIILMDIMMPELDGYETTRQIRERLNLKQLPIIALTAKAMKEDRDKCIAAGASDYISKPLNMKEVLSRMKLWLSHETLGI
ncbi:MULTISPECIES: CHASE3 domain-containing protein [Paenibacillus]|uniref:Circadian input-output histidine kinase CikA n=1 Tax=Paenibacillus pabuli TaxID=1472 RepID=A0A855XW55_9BACL|nr:MULTISPECIES: CHASE3 domain-containing protein [Paenibacillus]PWW38763.1 two-component system chemotaxis sensor kinase CheA [Paenibacillus pabuli]PXW05948.1 two-component system chemotaxis sensor kinase CheA [Paenibacillus taichungensis]RAI89886.1 two-component system chemotaxis sensor kinase CheA [Paenibacillus pabuli]